MRHLLLSVFCFVFIAYLFYGGSGGNQYGPRYLYSSAFAVFILMAAGIERLMKMRIEGVLYAVVIVNIIFLFFFSSIFHSQINERMLLYDTVKNSGISNAVVFLSSPSGSMPPLDLTRNGISFNGPVIYVLDMKEKNHLLIEDFPDRDYYSWVCEKARLMYVLPVYFRTSENINCRLTKLNR